MCGGVTQSPLQAGAATVSGLWVLLGGTDTSGLGWVQGQQRQCKRGHFREV